MKAFLTGATGFVGGRMAEMLRASGNDVACLVRSPEKARRLEGLGCELIEGDLSDVAAIERGVEGAELVLHVAADYRVGVHDSVREKMFDANVGGTERVIDAAHRAGAKKIVYVSTMNVFGNTHGAVADETTPHRTEGHASKYEESKVKAHAVAMDKARAGAPVVIVQPGAIYGPGDPSALGTQLKGASRGKLPGVGFGDFGMCFVHVDDVAEGIRAAAQTGRAGESYILGGENATLRQAIDLAAEAGGKKPPRIDMPTSVIKVLAKLPGATKAMQMPPNADEVIRIMDGATIWGSHEKAARELGYAPRDLRTGLADTFSR